MQPKEIKNYIENLPHRKTPGEDMIPNIVLKNLNSKAIVYLFNVFNGCLRLNYFPKSWKNAIVITLQKSGKPKNSLLNSISKLFEKVLHTLYKTLHSFHNTSLDLDNTTLQHMAYTLTHV